MKQARNGLTGEEFKNYTKHCTSLTSLMQLKDHQTTQDWTVNQHLLAVYSYTSLL